MNQEQIVDSLLAAARGAVVAQYGARAGVLWPMVEPSARMVAEELAAELLAPAPAPAPAPAFVPTLVVPAGSSAPEHLRRDALVARFGAPLEPAGTDLAIWIWQGESRKGLRYYAAAYAGKSSKPLWNYAFLNEDDRSRKIESTIGERKARQMLMQQKAEARRSFAHPFRVGDILSSSWGYDQTNVDFYEVVETTEREVTLREIGKRGAGGPDEWSDYVVPLPGVYVGDPLRRRPTTDSVKIETYKYATKWDGKPERVTSGYAGH